MRARRPCLLPSAVLTLGLLAFPVASQARDHLEIVGSSTVYPFASAVAEHFGAEGRFKTPVVESLGTGGGFKVFCVGAGEDTPDINDASRPITDGERATCAADGVTGIAEVRFGYDGIVVASSTAARPFDLTRDQLYRAVAKTVPVNGKLVPNPNRTWSDVDPKLPKRPIHLYGPGVNHGTRDAFVELVMQPACEKHPEVAALSKDEKERVCSAVREDGAWIDVTEDYAVLVGKLENDPEALAIFTFSYLDQNRNAIQAARIDGVAPTLDTIADASYPISRPLFIYVKNAHLGVVPGLDAFVTEMVSDRAAGEDGYLTDKGLIPMPAAELRVQQAKVKALLAR